MLFRSDSVAAVTISVATLLPMVASLALMLRARSHVSNLKQAEGWIASGSRSVAFVGGDDVPQPTPLAWELLHLVIIAALAAFVLLAYDRLPEQLPMHADMGGTVTDYAAKSPRAVLFPILEAVFMGVVFTLCHWGILRSKRPVDPEAPATSAYAYGRFAQVQSLVLLVGGLALNVSMGTALLLSWLGIMGLEASGILVSVVALAFVLVEIWVSVRMGQSGGRMAAELRTSDGVARDDDRYYKLGFAYVNPDDPSIWVPKRFGVGWTLNFGQPMAWVTIGLFAALVAGFAAWALRLEG